MLSLENKTALVTGVADNVGFGWHIAKMLQACGADVVISCHPRVQSIIERFLEKDKYAESRLLPNNKGSLKPSLVIPCDVGIDTTTPESMQEQGDVSIENMMKVLEQNNKKIDILVHSVAFSPEITKSHLEVSRNGYLTALSVSSYSLVALARAATPLMTDRNAAIIALSYLASERVVPFYGGGMASAKAALECDARMLAWWLGEQGHRVNVISAGPYASRAAKSIGDLDSMIELTAARSPLRRAITAEEVANTAAFLCSDLASGITGEVVHVDAGYHAMGV